MSKYANKRQHRRAGNGQFRRATPADIGIGGVCPRCNHLLVRHYDGDETQYPLDPARFRYRCFSCEPMTSTEKAQLAKAESAREPSVSILGILLRNG